MWLNLAPNSAIGKIKAPNGAIRKVKGDYHVQDQVVKKNSEVGDFLGVDISC